MASGVQRDRLPNNSLGWAACGQESEICLSCWCSAGNDLPGLAMNRFGIPLYIKDAKSELSIFFSQSDSLSQGPFISQVSIRSQVSVWAKVSAEPIERMFRILQALGMPRTEARNGPSNLLAGVGAFCFSSHLL